MKTNLILLLVVASLTLLGCKDPIPDPEQAVLILPEDNTSCLYVSQSSSLLQALTFPGKKPNIQMSI